MKLCSIENCYNKTFSRSLHCPTHIHRRKKGIPLHLPINYLEHGLTKTTEYRSWAMMKNRCLNPEAKDFNYYGGRGITLCKRWFHFKTFLKDMGLKPTVTHSIDRVNNDKGYSPSNCRWATKKEQRANQRRCL